MVAETREGEFQRRLMKNWLVSMRRAGTLAHLHNRNRANAACECIYSGHLQHRYRDELA